MIYNLEIWILAWASNSWSVDFTKSKEYKFLVQDCSILMADYHRFFVGRCNGYLGIRISTVSDFSSSIVVASDIPKQHSTWHSLHYAARQTFRVK